MSAATAGGTAGATAAAAIANAIKVSGVLVKVEPDDLQFIINRQEEPLVVAAKSGFFGTTYRYLCSYKGLAFYAENSNPIELPGTCEVVRAKKIWIPG